MTVSSTSTTFVDRHIGARRQADIDVMLKSVGYDSVDSLVDTAVPNDIRQDVALTLQNALSEVEVLAELRKLAAKNKTAVQMMSKKLGTDPDHVTREQVPELLEALGPTLRTLLGKSGADTVAAEIRKELAL